MSTDAQQSVPSASAGEPQYAAPNAPYVPPGGPYAGQGTPYPPPYAQGQYAPNPGAPFYPQYATHPGVSEPPAVWPVALFTFFFGVFGAISAARRSNKARAVGVSGGRYWGTFAGVLGASWLLGIMFIVIVAAAASTTSTITNNPAGATVMDASTLETSIVQQGDFKDITGAPAKAASATCVKVAVSTEGAGTYRCMVDFTDAARRSYNVTVAPNGTWVTDSGT